MICAKFFSRDVVNTLRIKIQDNQGIVQFVNHQDEIVHLRKEKAVGILDLRSVGYFKVGYQKMVNMAESNKVFKMYHYQQVKCGTEIEADQYMRITGKYKTKGSMSQIDEEERVERHRKCDPYLWLTKDDPRRSQSDEEILYEKIDLSDSALSRKEKSRLMKMLIKYRDAFSLRDEIGECPNLKADIKVIDESPFFVRPFPISEKDKPFMDEQMERLVSLGILSKNSTSHTSPVMLITRKMTKDKRPVVDFRLLNTRILRRNTSIPLMSHVLSILGNSECEVVSCVDIKDAYHSLRLTEKSKEYCGILPYFGSPIYRYEVLPMGIACAPQIWMDSITLILSELEDKKKYIAIMDDLLIHSTKMAHWKLLEQLLRSMCKNGLRLSPKKCQLFKTKLTYMGNEFSINKRTMTITPLRSRTEAINKIPVPRTPKQCKSFCGVVNYLSLFCPDLQKLLKPIVDLTRKDRPFMWGEAQEKAFNEVKLRLKNPPVLHLPRAEGRFILYSDTSIEGTGSSLWQIQEVQTFSVDLYDIQIGKLDQPIDLERFMETMDTNGQKISTVEEREAEQPMQKIMPRWLNNVLVMTCTAMTTVLMIIILVLLAKHFKMKALVSMLAIQTVPPPAEAVNLTAAMMSAMIAPDPAIGTKVVCAYPVAVIWQNILGYLVLIYAITQFFRPVTWCKGYKYNKKCALYIFVYDEDHERYSPLKIMSLKGQMHNYRMKYTGEGISLTLVRSWTYDTMTISWGGVQVMDKNDPINLPATVTVALRHKIMTRRIAQQLGEVQYMLKQGSSWHDITDYYRARKKAVNLRVESGDRGVTSSPKKVRKEKSHKKTKVQEEPVEV